ncbi:MAG: alpha/beta fold hydrolase [Cyanobacteria bacterium CRU_2_1]|nr:alpha/beta fold hydrolase [Cyanobacteria bacterium CRU_2_1]
MPKITVGDLDINYNIQGQGDPLLMIMGLSFSLLDWGTKLPELLSRHYKVILFDNRDAGETSRSPHPYTIAQMADDAAVLLDALGESRASVFGVSMGGMIAQHFALNHADKLNKLILGCTMAGGSCSQLGAFSNLFNGNVLELLFTPGFIQQHQTDLKEFFQTTTPLHSKGDALARQFYAMSNHDTCDRLGKITAPTLVMTGDSDRVIPPQNSDILTQKISGAKQEIIQDAAHAFCFSHPDSTATAILNFLEH